MLTGVGGLRLQCLREHFPEGSCHTAGAEKYCLQQFCKLPPFGVWGNQGRETLSNVLEFLQVVKDGLRLESRELWSLLTGVPAQGG